MAYRSIKVKDEYRKNPLSFIPGGSTVTIVFEDGLNIVYNKIKSPRKFIKKISEDPAKGKIVVVLVDGKPWKLDWLY